MNKYDFTTYQTERPNSSKWRVMHKAKPDVAKGIVPLSVADMEFAIQPELEKAICEYAHTANFGYYMPTDDYFETVCDFLSRRHGLSVNKDEIVTSQGIVNALSKAVRRLTDPGDEVMIFTPVYYPFYSAIKDEGRVIADCPLIHKDNYYSIDFDKTEELAKTAKAMIICNPHNPVGRVWTKEELTKLAQIAEKNNMLIISDDIHLDFVRKPHKHTFISTVSDYAKNNTVTCTAPSKSFNLAALGCSNIIIQNPELKARFDDRRNGLNPFSYLACKTVYTSCTDWLDECLDLIYENVEFTEKYFKDSIPEAVVTPLEGTYLMWIDFSFLGLSPEKLKELFVSHDLFLDGGEVFGKMGEGYERINIAVPKKVLMESLERFSEAVEDAKKNY